MLTRRLLPGLLAGAVLIAAPACATGGYYRYPTSTRTVDDRAYQVGYDQGRKAGKQDARRGRDFDYARHDEFRDGDKGYRGLGKRNAYRQVYRQGFVEGYDDGYRRYARNGNGYPRRGPGVYRDSNRSPTSGQYRSPAAENGFRDGYEQGRSDARDRDRFDPVRARRYREGDHDYNGRYGSREEYKREYRAAFEQGYEQGYRESRR